MLHISRETDALQPRHAPRARGGWRGRERARARERERERRGACSRPCMRRLRTGRLPRKNMMMTAVALGIQKQDKQEAPNSRWPTPTRQAARPRLRQKNRYASRQEMEGWRAGNGRRDPNPFTCQTRGHWLPSRVFFLRATLPTSECSGKGSFSGNSRGAIVAVRRAVFSPRRRLLRYTRPRPKPRP